MHVPLDGCGVKSYNHVDVRPLKQRSESVEGDLVSPRVYKRECAAKRYKRVDRAIAVIWKMLMVAEQRFRRLKAPELIEDVYLGAQYADGIAIESTAEKVAA